LRLKVEAYLYEGIYRRGARLTTIEGPRVVHATSVRAPSSRGRCNLRLRKRPAEDRKNGPSAQGYSATIAIIPSGGPGRYEGHWRRSVQRISPGNYLEPAVIVLGERGATFYPVAAIHISNAMFLADDSVMDVTADYTIGTVTARLTGERLFKCSYIVHPRS
jgi:hypothetical protein